MDEPYVPKVNDYVVWDKGEFGIEAGIKPKPKCQYSVNERHKFIHTLLLCHQHQWKELKYIKSRESAHPHHYSECDN